MTRHMYGYGKWKSDVPASDEMIRALADVINENRQPHKMQPAAFMPLNQADRFAYVTAVLIDLWQQCPDADLESLISTAGQQLDVEESTQFEDTFRRVLPLLSFPDGYRPLQ